MEVHRETVHDGNLARPGTHQSGQRAEEAFVQIEPR